MNMARLNVTYAGHNSDIPDLVPYDASDSDLLRMAEEAVRSGSAPGIPASPDASFVDFVVDRFPATDVLPNRIFVRPKTPFGARPMLKRHVHGFDIEVVEHCHMLTATANFDGQRVATVQANPEYPAEVRGNYSGRVGYDAGTYLCDALDDAVAIWRSTRAATS